MVVLQPRSPHPAIIADRDCRYTLPQANPGL